MNTIQQEPSVHIVVLNWNGKHDTLECLKSLTQIDYRNYRIILVDNASTDGIVAIVQDQFPDVVILKNEANLGFAEGNNVGIRYALSQQCDYLMLLNNDTVVDPSFLSALVNIGEKYPDLGMLSPLIYWYKPPEKIWFYSGEINWKNGYSDHRKIPEQGVVKNMISVCEYASKEYLEDSDYLSGCALLVKTQVIQTIGLLDKRFFIYCEDVDWCVRCQKAGWRLAVVPSSRIWHKVSSSAISDYSRFLSYRNAILLLWKHSNIFQFLLRVKRHIYRTLAEYSWDREEYYATLKPIPLDGVWAGLSGKYGNTCQKMPGWLQRFVYRNIRYLLWIFRYPR
jgi:GT2 family glycosyltransferase